MSDLAGKLHDLFREQPDREEDWCSTLPLAASPFGWPRRRTPAPASPSDPAPDSPADLRAVRSKENEE